MNKFLDAKFITGIITMLAITLNNKFAWHLNEVQLAASIGVAVNFILVQLAVDIKKIKAGGKMTWNSTKFVTMLVACLLIGFTQYVGFELDTETVLWIAGTAAAFITGKGIRDIIQVKGENVHESEKNIIGGGPAV